MWLVHLILIISALSPQSRAATSLKLTKHKTDSTAYLNHLARRGIIPNQAQHKRSIKKHQEEVRRAQVEQSKGKRGEGLVYRYFEEYDPRKRQDGAEDETRRYPPHTRQKRQGGAGSSSKGFSATSSSDSKPGSSDGVSQPTSSSAGYADGKYRWAAAIDTSYTSNTSAQASSSPAVADNGQYRWAAAADTSGSSSWSSSSSATQSSNTGSSIMTGSITDSSVPDSHPTNSPNSNPAAQSGSSSIISPNPSPTASSVSAGPTQPQPSDLTYELDDRFGIAYTIDALIGEEKTPVPVLVDTGSATFWVASKQCQYCASSSSCSSCSASKMTQSLDMGDTCPKGNESVKLYYGKGEVFGCAKNSRIQVGDLYLDNFPVVGVTTIDQDTAGLGDVYSGMWGIASKNLNQLGDTPIDKWYAARTISSPEVGFFFVRENDTASNGAESEVVVGDALNLDSLDFPIDQNVMAKLPRFGDDSGHYTVKLDKMSSWGTGISGFENKKVIVDTGSTMFIVPQSMLKPIFGTLMNGTVINHPKDHKFVLPCNLMDPTATALTLTMGGVDFSVQFRDLLYGPVNEFPGYCYGALMSLDDSLVLLGGTFLVNVYHSVNTQTGDVTMYGLKQ